MLMSDSLGGNAKTLMIVNISPAESNLNETYNSLIYASRVRSIVNDPSKNVSSKEVEKLKKEVAYWKKQAGKRRADEDHERPPNPTRQPVRFRGVMTGWVGLIHISTHRLCFWYQAFRSFKGKSFYF